MSGSAKLLIALTIAVIVAAIWYVFRPVSYRYRLVVEVETPSGLRTGSAVHEVIVKRELIPLPDGQSAIVKLRGEAVPVEIERGKYLFALLSSERRGEESILPAVHSALDPQYQRGGLGNLAAARKLAGFPEGTLRPLAETNSFEQGKEPFRPMLVTFGDPANSATIRRVDPRKLDADFGPGVRLVSMSIATTKEPVTEQILSILPWLGTKPSSLDPLWKGSAHPSFAQLLSHSDFKKD